MDAVSSMFDKKLNQNVLLLHMSSRATIKVLEEDVESVLEDLGLAGEYADDWVLDLQKDLG